MAVSTKKLAVKEKLSWKQRFIIPILLLCISFVLILLPLSEKVNSFRALMSFVFVPQVRAANGAMQYAYGVNQTVKNLLSTYQENINLKQELDDLRLQNIQVQNIIEENARLNSILSLQKNTHWNGLWARVIYRNPEQWDTFLIDKGQTDGIKPRSAVLAVQDGQFVLAGMVLEASESISKVIFITHEDFSSAVFLKQSNVEGLLVGKGQQYLLVQYLPTFSTIEESDDVYTSSSSVIFPKGLLIGQVKKSVEKEGTQTSQSVFVKPLANVHVGRELFIVLEGKEK